MFTTTMKQCGKLSCCLLAFFAFSVTSASAMMAASSMPSECQTFCSSTGGKSHALCTALLNNGKVTPPSEGHPYGEDGIVYKTTPVAPTANPPVLREEIPLVSRAPEVQPIPMPARAVLEEDPITVASTGLPKECNTFCNSKAGAGHALCIQAQAVASTTSSRGGSGLMVNETYGTNTTSSSNADPIAARLSIEQQQQALSLGQHVTKKGQEAQIRYNQSVQAAAQEQAARLRAQAEAAAREAAARAGRNVVEP